MLLQIEGKTGVKGNELPQYNAFNKLFTHENLNAIP
jgi:hypothetical protein